MLQAVVSLFLLGHALIHASFLRPRPPARPGGPAWPFDLGHSRALDRIGLDARSDRAVGIAIVAAIIASYTAAAAAFWIPALEPAFVISIVLGSLSWAFLICLFFHPWLTLGLVIDALLVWAVLVLGSRP